MNTVVNKTESELEILTKQEIRRNAEEYRDAKGDKRIMEDCNKLMWDFLVHNYTSKNQRIDLYREYMEKRK